MNIALISTPFITVPPEHYGGLERVVWDLANGLVGMGERVVIFATERSKQLPGGLTIETVPCNNNPTSDWLALERNMWKVYDPMLDNFDIVHGHNWFGFEYATKIRNMDLSVCHTHHGHMNTAWWTRSRPEFDPNIFAISDFMCKEYTMFRFNSKRVYNGVDLDSYEYQKDKSDRLLFVGRIAEYKQPHIAIKVAQDLGMGLDIVGGSFVDNSEYLNQVVGMADGDQIKVHLDAPHKLKEDLMKNAKCLLFPSRMDEPFGLVMVEALACGTPVVALDDGAVTEIITSDTGSVCRAKTDEQAVALMSHAVKELNVKPSDCRKRAERFSKEHMAQKYLEYYREIIKGHTW